MAFHLFMSILPAASCRTTNSGSGDRCVGTRRQESNTTVVSAILLHTLPVRASMRLRCEPRRGTIVVLGRTADLDADPASAHHQADDRRRCTGVWVTQHFKIKRVRQQYWPCHSNATTMRQSDDCD